MFSEIRQTYQDSMKPADSLFNLYVARPLAAPLVVLFSRTPITPNQVTLLSILPMLAGLVAWLTLPGSWGLWLGVIGVELAYIMDCVDGQLARVTGRTSIIGGELDFLMDELKAVLLIGALTVRWSLFDGGGTEAFIVGIATLAVLAIALSLTRFIRTDLYAEATGTEKQNHGEAAGAARQRKSPLWPVEMVARLISQYPVTLPLFAAFGRMDLFVWAYGVVHVLYAGRTFLSIMLRLGRFEKDDDGSPS
jgi:phosphatidylglycerophosphate synthase